MSTQNHNDDEDRRARRSRRRSVMGAFLLAFLIFGGMFAWLGYQLYRDANAAIENNPILNLGKNLLLQATPEIVPKSSTILNSVSELARLETARVEAEKIVTSERDTQALFGLFGESLVFVAVGEVIAGVDLAKMADGDIQVVDPVTVMVYLPEAEILVATLDNQKSYVVDRDVGLFTGADPELETQVRQIGEASILEYALDEVKILEVADQNAQEYMEGFLNDLGFENVIFTDETPPVPEPYEQEIPKGRILTTPAP